MLKNLEDRLVGQMCLAIWAPSSQKQYRCYPPRHQMPVATDADVPGRFRVVSGAYDLKVVS